MTRSVDVGIILKGRFTFVHSKARSGRAVFTQVFYYFNFGWGQIDVRAYVHLLYFAHWSEFFDHFHLLQVPSLGGDLRGETLF